MLVTRTVPPLPLARLRAGGEMAEIGARELRFAVAEAALLVGAASGTELSKANLAVLMEQTEGWPAGLYLAALSLRGHPSPGVFIRQFTGDNEFIADLLAEEVISRQPDEIQEFLARTAILDRFCAPLCDAVTGSANAAQIIDVLERDIRFIVPLDECGGGTAITIFSHRCSAASSPLPSLTWCPRCTGGPADGIGGQDRQMRRSVTRLPPVTLPRLSI